MKRKLKFILILVAIVSLFFQANCTELPSALPFFNSIEVQITAGDAPDVMFMDSLNAPAYIQNEIIPAISGQFDTEDFYPQTLSAFQKNGELYALPHDFQPAALLYNADFFEKYGVEPPSNWDELYNLSTKLTEELRAEGNEGFAAFGLTATLWNWSPFLYQAGGSVKDLTSPEAVKALDFYTSLVTSGGATVGKGSWPHMGAYPGDSDLLDRFAQGQIVMLIAGPSVYKYLSREMGVPVSLAPLPAGPDGRQATVAYVRGYALSSRGMDNPLAQRFLQYITDPKAMQYWTGNEETPLDYIPARKSMADSWLNAHPDTKVFLESINTVQTEMVSVPSTGTLLEFDRYGSEIMLQVLNQQIPVQDALNQLQGQAREMGISP
jgi:multiple sugar transport system substrate-binding protein